MVVHDLRFERLRWLAPRLDGDVVVIHVYVDPALLKQRLFARAAGFRDVPAALAWNERVGRADDGWRVDNDVDPEKTAEHVLRLLRSTSR